jgi:hypothetical protein
MSDSVDPMSPEASPHQLSKHSGAPGHTLPVYLQAAVAGFLAIMVVVAAIALPSRPNMPPPRRNQAGYPDARCGIAGERADGIIPPDGAAAQSVAS